MNAITVKNNVTSNFFQWDTYSELADSLSSVTAGSEADINKVTKLGLSTSQNLRESSSQVNANGMLRLVYICTRR
jgi:hypothetical protein